MIIFSIVEQFANVKRFGFYIKLSSGPTHIYTDDYAFPRRYKTALRSFYRNNIIILLYKDGGVFIMDSKDDNINNWNHQMTKAHMKIFLFKL